MKQEIQAEKCIGVSGGVTSALWVKASRRASRKARAKRLVSWWSSSTVSASCAARTGTAKRIAGGILNAHTGTRTETTRDRHPSGSRQDTHGTPGPVRGEAVWVAQSTRTPTSCKQHMAHHFEISYDVVFIFSLSFGFLLLCDHSFFILLLILGLSDCLTTLIFLSLCYYDGSGVPNLRPLGLLQPAGELSGDLLPTFFGLLGKSDANFGTDTFKKRGAPHSLRPFCTRKKVPPALPNSFQRHRTK